MSTQAATGASSPLPGARSRYREERTLVRGLLPPPGQTSEEFKQNVRRLRSHFQQFNADVSGLCQWVIKFRPSNPTPIEGTQIFWDFFIQPERFVDEPDTSVSDRLRLEAFDAAIIASGPSDLATPPFHSALRASLSMVAQLEPNNASRSLFARLRTYTPTHRMILLKAAAEVVEARYERGYANWVRQHEEWAKEKSEWETKHPELTGEVRQAFKEIFAKLEISEKRPRICSLERLLQNRDNCEYGGEGTNKRHSQLCLKYQEFLRKERPDLPPNWKRYFFENARAFLESGISALPPPARPWFPRAWRDYLQEMQLREDGLRQRSGGRLPHCKKLGGDCEFNPHTEKCREYKELLRQAPSSLANVEPLYREWRRHYLSGPRKPEFHYPSARSNSIAKIFGKAYQRVDFEKSELGIRLDDMAEGEFLPFRFKPWPRDYSPQPNQAEITSVQVHFVGTRPRVGFRFRVPHRPSRFACSQDELEGLRSRTFPRVAQDQQFLEEARRRLLGSFQGQPEKELRLLTVDLGDRGAFAALFEGKRFVEAHPLKVIKIDKLYEAPPNAESGMPARAGEGGQPPRPRLGLSKEHVGRHLGTLAEEASKIGLKRATEGAGTLRAHDLRGLTRHIAWMNRDWARLNASQIVRIAEASQVDLIVFESLRGFKPPGYDKLDSEKKRRLAFFAFGRIRRKVVEKAVERGMRVVTVPYFYSSQVCSGCGRAQENLGLFRKNKGRRRFRCEHKACGFQAHSDENAARVLGRVFWGEIVLPSQN